MKTSKSDCASRNRTFFQIHPDRAAINQPGLNLSDISLSNGVTVELSIIIPAYNEERRITRTLDQILAYLDDQRLEFEVIVVNDGSRDRTVEAAAARMAGRPACRVVSLPVNRGKGAAVRRGIQEAAGRHILFSDADLSTPIEELGRLRQALEAGADLAIGSRALQQSQILQHQPWYREAMGKTFNLLVRAILGLSLHDTQCGFKCFTREAARKLIRLQQVEGWAFDAELLYLSRRLGMKVVEIPVRWINDTGTKVGIVRSSSQMLNSIIRVRVRDLLGGYDLARAERAETGEDHAAAG